MSVRGGWLAWLVMSALCLLALLAHQSDDGALLGRYSFSYGLMLLAMAGLTAAAGAGWLLAGRGRAPVLRLPALPLPGWLLIATGLIGLAAIWLLLPVSDTPAGRLFRVYLAALVIIMMLRLLVMSGRDQQPVSQRVICGGLAGMALVTALLTALYQGGLVPPSRFYDEGWLAGWSLSLLDDGPVLDSMFPTRDPLVVAVSTRLSLYGLGHWLSIAGVGIAQGRLYTALLAWLALPFIYLTARRLYGPVAALAALVAAALLPLHHSYVYPTGWVALTNALALYLFFRARADDGQAGRGLSHYLAGLVAVLGFEGHAYATAFAAALGGLYLLEYAGQIRRERRWRPDAGLWLFALGALTGVALVVGFRIWISSGLVNPASLSAALGAAYSVQTDIGGSGQSLIERVVNANLALYADYFVRHPAESILFAISLAAAIWRARPPGSPDRPLLLLLALALAAFAVLLAKPNLYYWVFFMPYGALLSGALIADAGRSRRRVNLAHVAAAAGVFVLLAAHAISTSRTQNVNDLIRVSAAVEAQLPPAADSVAAWETYFFGLHQRRFTATSSFYGLGDMLLPGAPPPAAVIVTRGLDDVPATLDYLAAHDLQPARCYPLSVFGGQAVLYLHADLLPAGAPLDCD